MPCETKVEGSNPFIILLLYLCAQYYIYLDIWPPYTVWENWSYRLIKSFGEMPVLSI